ncbi:MAG: putative baseplate assembly protein [Gemmatimonadaceae bacterium]
MTAQRLDCHEDARRATVRKAALNGLDYVEVSDDQLTLSVFFLGKAPTDISVENVRIEGGRRVRSIQVLSIVLHRDSRRGRDDSMDIKVAQPGDASVYTLRVIGPKGERMPGFDTRYTTLEFSFKANCPSDLDCVSVAPCTSHLSPRPDFNYLARDYSGFRQLLLDRLAVVLPEWHERHVPDFGIALVELLAYTGDYLSQYEDAVGTEAYLDTARLRISVRRHAQLVDYQLFEGSNARAWVVLDTNTDLKDFDLNRISFATRFRGGPEGRTQLTWAELSESNPKAYEVFEPLWPPRAMPFTAFAAHSRMEFYTWGDGECCLPAGATEATLVDAWADSEDLAAAPPGTAGNSNTSNRTPLAVSVDTRSDARRLDALKVGDVIVLQEVLGVQTGNVADANPSHRHAVRLTEVRRDQDNLFPTSHADSRGTPIVHVRWSDGDALPFSLCVSTRHAAPDCSPLRGVSIARGNVLLVDHGRTTEELLPAVPDDNMIVECDPCDDVRRDAIQPRFEPVLSAGPLTFAAPLDTSGSARQMALAAPQLSVPQVQLAVVVSDSERNKNASYWTAHEHLLNLECGEQAFVTEIDDDGFAHLRFATSLDHRPIGGKRFRALYRTGIGPDGNVGAGAIAYLVSDDLIASGAMVTVDNPLPASGGAAGESLTEAKQRAPGAFRRKRERAITAQDYAELLEAELATDIQGAASSLRWNGSWYEVKIGVDARGVTEASEQLQQRAREALYRYRRIGHDLQVSTAHLVPLAIGIDVCVASHMLRAAVRAEILERLGNGRGRDGQLGFFHSDSLQYGETITVSSLIVSVVSIPGVTSAAVTQLERMDEGPNQELENGLLPIGTNEIAQLDNSLNFPERGRLTLTLRGGR